MKIFAQIVSILLYPMFLPTYAVTLFFIALQRLGLVLHPQIWMIGIGTTCLYTCIFPLSVALFLYRTHKISNLMMQDRRERLMPYIYSICIMITWVFFLCQTHIFPIVINALAIAATALLSIVCIINVWWKISIHLTTMGALAGSVVVFSYVYSVIPIITFPVVLCLTILLMIARLYLKAHTPAQLIAGFLLGLLGTLTIIPLLV